MLEVTARAITYYLDVSAECTRRIVGVDGAIKALCNRLVVVELNNRTSRDLAEQCVKVGGERVDPGALLDRSARPDLLLLLRHRRAGLMGAARRCWS